MNLQPLRSQIPTNKRKECYVEVDDNYDEEDQEFGLFECKEEKERQLKMSLFEYC